MPATYLKIKDRAILVGYNPEGKCIYSDTMELSDYYDGEHVWDSGDTVKKIKLQKVRGLLFNNEGVLDQEFESVFDLKTGIFASGFVRYADGTIKHH